MTVKDKIMEALERYVDGPIRPAGAYNVVARCPFHNDKDPSFSMSTQNGLYLCFACGEQGNFYQFLNRMGLEKDQIRHHYGKTLEDIKENLPPPPDPSNPGVVVHEVNCHIPGDLLGVFHMCPLDLIEEGFAEETLSHFGVGVDTKHNRITFPLYDLEGHLVGISGRAMRKGQKPRYKVYHEEYRAWELPPYQTDKAKLLWNAHVLFPQFMEEEGPIVVVEGFKACMWLWQAGITNVVALMTKRMSWEQRWILQKLTDSLVLFLDNDEAGVDGTMKICKDLVEITTSLRIVNYNKKQPTDLPLKKIPKLIQNAVDYNMLPFL